MSEQERWVKLHIRLLDNPLFFTDHTALVIFIWCLLQAYPKGQFPTGRFILGKSVGLNPNTAYKALKRLEKYEMVHTKSNNKYTTVSICNWDKYQSRVTKSVNNTVTTEEQLSNNTVTQYNSIKNKNKNKNILPLIVLTDDQLNILKSKFPNTDVETQLESANDWILSKGKSFKDPIAFFRNWLRSSYQKKDDVMLFFEKATDGTVFKTKKDLEDAVSQNKYAWRRKEDGFNEYYPVTS